MVFLKVFQQCGVAPGQGFWVTRSTGLPFAPWVPFQPHPTGSGWCRKVISEEHQEFLQSEEKASEELSEGLLELHGPALPVELPARDACPSQWLGPAWLLGSRCLRWWLYKPRHQPR